MYPRVLQYVGIHLIDQRGEGRGAGEIAQSSQSGRLLPSCLLPPFFPKRKTDVSIDDPSHPVPVV